jgi:outer membrane protein OmpA-like peptidoglycan-associated protein
MRALVISAIVVGAVALTGCQATGNMGSKTAIGAAIGAGTGYAISRSNNNSSSQNNRALALGAIVGGGAGLYLDNKEAQLRQELQGSGVDVGRNPDGSVGLIMPGNITFATNQSTIKPEFYATLNKIAKVLAEDKNSGILVTGFTDSTGNDSINIPLSQARAQSVASYIASQGISTTRINAQGMGSANPIASNSTAEGRETNRRVELSIYAIQ